jgi:hypothetical protein
MRYVIAVVATTALAALSYVVCGYFANDAAKGIWTGFCGGAANHTVDRFLIGVLEPQTEKVSGEPQ